MNSESNQEIVQEYKYDFKEKEIFSEKFPKGLNEGVVSRISNIKQDPQWLLDFRLNSYKTFLNKKMPTWGANLSVVDFDDIVYYLRAIDNQASDWNDLPEGIKNTWDKLGIPEAERKFLSGVGAQYECLSEDTEIFTNPKGPVKIKNIEVGDYVFSFDEDENSIKKAKVLAKLEKGENQVYEIVVDNKVIKSTANHPLLVLSHYKKEGARRGRYLREWKSLKDLKVGDLVAVAKKLPFEGKSYILEKPIVKDKVVGRNQFGAHYSLDISKRYNKVSLPLETNNDLMWFFGLYIGDGYVKREKNKDKKRVYFAIPASQNDLREELKKVVKNLFDYEVRSEDNDKIIINSTIISDFIELNGFKGNAHQKRVPQWVLSLSEEQRLAFLAGYVDSDGYVGNTKKCHNIIFKSPNKDLINDFRNLSIYCNFHPSNIHLVRSKHPIDKERIMISHQIEISGNLAIIPSRYSFKSSRLKEKKLFHNFSVAQGTDFRKHVNDYFGFSKIKSIKPVGVEKVYDITVENYHNFIANGLIVHNSENVYHSIRRELALKGVIFTDPDTGLNPTEEKIVELAKHLDIPIELMRSSLLMAHEKFKEYFSKIIPAADNKFAALNSAVFSGGSFIYVPKGVKLDMALPLQAYFRINSSSMGQFERTLIIADEDSQVSYVEGCSAPIYSTKSLHAAVVEVVALKNAHVRYTTIQNWSGDVLNLVTKRAFAYENAFVEWIDCNLGSAITMKYPSVFLLGQRARADLLSIAYAGKGQHQDAGSKAVHIASNTSSRIISKSISKDGGKTTFRALIKIGENAKNCKVSSQCDALILDEHSLSDTLPLIEIASSDADVNHEASAGKIDEDQLFYLMSRGLSEQEAKVMIVLGFLTPIVKTLPLEYAVEMNKLIDLEMIGSVG